MKTIISFLLLLCSFKVFAVLPQVNFTFASRDITEGQEVTVTAELSSLTSNGVTVPFTVAGSANSDDHDLVPETIYISPNHKKGFITFKVFADGIQEGTENILISLLAPMNATLGSTKTHTIYIHDEDEINLPIVNFTTTSASTSEGNLVFVEATLSEASSQYVVVPFSVGGTAQYPLDHNLISRSLIFFPGSTTATLAVLVNEDGQAESNETIIIHLNAPVVNANLGTRSSHTITIESTSVIQPVADFSIGLSNGGVAPTQGSFNGALSYLPGHENEADRGITSCTWVLSGGSTGDKSIIIPGCLYEPTISIKGQYSLTLTVTSQNGAFSSISKNFQVLENLAPIANFTVNPNSGTAPIEVTLDGSSSSDPDGGAILEYRWDFGNGDTSVTSSPIITYTYNSSGSFIIKLSVKDNEGSISVVKTFTIAVSSPITQGTISGLTYRKEFGIVGNVPVTITFSNQTTFSTISDNKGKFSLTVPLSGNYTLSAEVGDMKAITTGNVSTSQPTQELPVDMIKTGIGKFAGTAVMFDNESEIVPNATIVIRAFNNEHEAFTTTDQNGKFSFTNLPLVGRYYISLFHEDGRFRNSSFIMTETQPEITNINYGAFTLPGFPFLSNSAFPYGGFESWFGTGDVILAPQSSIFGTSKSSNVYKSSTQPEPIPYPIPIDWFENEPRLPPRPLKPKPQMVQINELKNLPCENYNNSAVVTTNIPPNFGIGTLDQYITIENDADTFIGRVKFLTNETDEEALLGYNDGFTVLLQNPTRSIFLKQGDVKSLTWGPGTLGFNRATQEFTIAADIRHLRGMKAKLSFIVFDRGDLFGSSGMAVSNVQIIKSSERNLVATGSFTGNGSFNNNVGAVSWLNLKNNSSLSAFTLNAQNFIVLGQNEQANIPSVKFGNEPMARTFNIEALNSTDSSNYILESNWVNPMPSSVCLGGGR